MGGGGELEVNTTGTHGMLLNYRILKKTGGTCCCLVLAGPRVSAQLLLPLLALVVFNCRR